jgi:pimeloyl-ACP methyl ester carboxylesterase
MVKAIKESSGKSTKHRWKFRTKVTGALGLLFLSCFLALAAFPGLSPRFDDPHRLAGTIRILSTNGFTLRWVEKKAVGNAKLDIVFVHGTPGGAGVWAAQFRSPYPEANLFAFDRPGFGGSGPSERKPHLQIQADALFALLNSITTNRVMLVGHSYGSPVALLTALEHPERVSGVLLIGGDIDPAEEHPFWIQYFFNWRCTSWLLPHALRQCNRELLSVRADLTGMQRKLPLLTVPVVMLHGDRDPLVPVQNVNWLIKQLAADGKSSLFAAIILPGVNHFIPWERPDKVAEAIQKLNEMEASQHPGH